MAQVELYAAMTRSERGLVQPETSESRRVRATGFIDDHRRQIGPEQVRVFERDGERERARIVCMDERRPESLIHAPRHSVEVHQRCSLYEGSAKPDVVTMLSVRASISVADHAIVLDTVLVRW